MSLINKIELSNFLDKSGGDNWTPTYRHNVLELNGQNTAIVLMNGSGKTTIATAFLAVLSRQKSLVSTMRTVFSPSDYGVYTHFRIEFIQPDMKTSVPTLPTIDTTVTGETYVFGVCGHKDDNKSLKFYCYPGTLEDVPVVEFKENTTHLLLNKEFEKAIRAKNDSRYSNITVDEWLHRVHDHCGAQQLDQMVAFLKDGGGDKSASLYNTKVARGQKFHESFFYTHIAPQLTIGEATSESEKGEIFLDDTIVSYSLNIVETQLAGKEKEKRIDRKRKAYKIFTDIKQLRENIVTAEQNYRKASRKIAKVAATVKYLVLDNPLPGFPRPAFQEHEVLHDLINNIVIVPDPDEPFLLQDIGLAGLLKKNIKDLDEKIRKASVQHASSSQYIDVASEFKIQKEKRHHKSKLYSRNSILKFIQTVEIDYLKAGGTEADRKTLIELIRSAFSIFASRCDTNPLREKANLIITEVRTVKETMESLNNDLKRIEEEKAALEENLQLLKTNKIAFDTMRDSGLFSEDELADPEHTKESLKAEAQSLEEGKKAAENNIRSLHGKYELYQQFHSEYPMESPDEHLHIIEKEERRLTDLLTKTRSQRDAAGEQLNRIETEFKKVESERKTINRDYKNIEKVHPGYLVCKDSFPEEDPIGFESRIRERGRALHDDIVKNRAELEQAEKGYAFELEFYTEVGEIDPAEWLAGIDEERTLLLGKTVRLTSDIEQYEAELELLRQNKVAPGANAAKILRRIPADIKYQPLHSFIKDNSPTQKQAELFLTLFSSMLFAPVLKSEKEISTLLDMYSKAGEDVLLPVFHEASLQEFLLQNNPLIRNAEDDVFYLIGGRKTSLIECILDSEKVEKKRIEVESTLKERREELQQLQERITQVSSNSRLVTLAQKAKSSKDNQLSLKVKRLSGKLDELNKAQNTHLSSFTNEVISSIKAAEKFLILGGPDAFTKLYDQKVLQQKTYDRLVVEITAQREKFAKLNLEPERISLELAEYKDKNRERKLNLTAVMKFLPEGLQTYTTATALVAEAEGKLALIRKKQDHELSRAAGYVMTLHINNENELQEQFEKLNIQKAVKTQSLSQHSEKLKELQEALRLQQKYSQEYDRFLILINDLYKKALMNHQFACDDEDMDLGTVIHLSSDLTLLLQRFQSDFSGIAEVSQAILNLLDKDNFDVLNARVSSAREKVKECSAKFDARCDREAKMSAKETVLNREEINLIQEVKAAPEKINHWTKLFEESLQTETADLSKGREHEEKLRNTLAGNLTALTDKATGNLRILRQVLKETADSASYSIQCEIATRENIESSIDEMVEMVKTAHERYRGDRTDPYEELGKAAEDEHKRQLKERVSEKCYRSIFLKPMITYKHPDIRGGHVTPFNIDKGYKGISEGEKTSLALLMQVIMARYSQKRKFAEEIGQGIRKRRDAAEAPNVLMIDGLFSSLSKPSLINQAFKSIKNTQGAFQIIGLIHNTTYVNSHDFNVFPNLFIGRTYTNDSSNDDNEGWVAFEHRQKEMIGQMAFANFQATKRQGEGQ